MGTQRPMAKRRERKKTRKRGRTRRKKPKRRGRQSRIEWLMRIRPTANRSEDVVPTRVANQGARINYAGQSPTYVTDGILNRIKGEMKRRRRRRRIHIDRKRGPRWRETRREKA